MCICNILIYKCIYLYPVKQLFKIKEEKIIPVTVLGRRAATVDPSIK